jgi:hypothetical protein
MCLKKIGKWVVGGEIVRSLLREKDPLKRKNILQKYFELNLK